MTSRARQCLVFKSLTFTFIGRDWFVNSAVEGTHHRNRWWKAEVEWRMDLLEEGSDGVYLESRFLDAFSIPL